MHPHDASLHHCGANFFGSTDAKSPFVQQDKGTALTWLLVVQWPLPDRPISGANRVRVVEAIHAPNASLELQQRSVYHGAPAQRIEGAAYPGCRSSLVAPIDLGHPELVYLAPRHRQG